jgi:hypothetical protein
METKTKLAYFYIAAMFTIAFLSSLSSLRNSLFFLSVMSVSGLGGIAVWQIQKHGKKRWWIGAIATVALLIFIVLMMLPGPFLYPLIPFIEN